MAEEQKEAPKQEPKTEEVKVEAKEKEITPQEEFKPIEIPLESWETSPLFYEVAGYFNIEPSNYKQSAEKLSVITDWAIGEANSNKLHDILPIIRRLEDKVMKPAWGETRYGKMYQYLRLSIKRDAWDKALNSMERIPKKNE